MNPGPAETALSNQREGFRSCAAPPVMRDGAVPYEVGVDTIDQILLERSDPVPEMTQRTLIANPDLGSLNVASLVARLENRWMGP